MVKKNKVDEKSQIRFAFQVAGIMSFLGLLLPFFKPFSLHGNVQNLIVLSIVSGVFGALCFIFGFLGSKGMEAGIFTIVSNIYTPITIILASFLLNEKLTFMQIIGTLLLLIGMVIVSKKHRIDKFKFDRYFMYSLLSGATLGVSLVAERGLQKITGFTAGTLLSWWSQFLILGVIALFFSAKNEYSKKNTAITGGLRFLQYLSWAILTVVVGNLSIVSSITTFKIVVVFIAAAIFLRERDDIQRKITGSLIALIGLLLSQ